MEGYEELWREFREKRLLELGGHTDPSWRDGHDRSASFVVPVDASKVREGLEPLREALRPFPFVSLHPDHFLHVTLLLPGFLAAEPEGEWEVSLDRLRELASEAQETVSKVAPFSVSLRNLNAFPGAVFVEVHDRGEMDGLREAIRARCGLAAPPGPCHLTLGYIKAPDGTPAPRSFVETIERHRRSQVGVLRVDHVDLTLLDLDEEYPKPEVFAGLPLGATPAD